MQDILAILSEFLVPKQDMQLLGTPLHSVVKEDSATSLLLISGALSNIMEEVRTMRLI